MTDLGLRGLKLHPIHQAFQPNDERFYPLYGKCVDLGVPVLIHTPASRRRALGCREAAG